MAVTPISGLMSAAGIGSIAPVTPATTAAADATELDRRCRQRVHAGARLAAGNAERGRLARADRGHRQPHRHPQLHDRRDRGVAHHRAHRRGARPCGRGVQRDHEDAGLMPVVDVDRLKEQSRRFVDGFTPGQKAMTILGVVAVVLAGMTFMKWASKPDYAPLYTGLSSQDAGAVTTALDAQHVKYKITGGGGTIMVPTPGRRQDPHRPQREEHPRGRRLVRRCSTSRASPPTSSPATSTTSARCRTSSARRSSRSTRSRPRPSR